MNNLYLLIIAGLFVAITIFSLEASAQESYSIPSWVKNNAKYWSEGSIGDSDFIKGIQYLIDKDILHVSNQPSNSLEQELQHAVQTITSGISSGHYTIIANDTVNWYFSDSKGNRYHWYIPMSTYDNQVRVDTSLLIGTQYLKLTNGTQLLAQNYAPLAQALVANHGFSKVIDQVYDKAGSDEQFIYEVWYITSEMTTYSKDITDSNLTPFEVLTRGQGDCKDKSILIASMLRSSSHTANWNILLEEMDLNNPTDPKTMNHMIVIVDTGQKAYGIESTATPDNNGLNVWAGVHIYGWQIPV